MKWGGFGPKTANPLREGARKKKEGTEPLILKKTATTLDKKGKKKACSQKGHGE